MILVRIHEPQSSHVLCDMRQILKAKRKFQKTMQHLFAHRTNQMNVIAKQLGQTKWSVHPKTLLRKIWAGEILQETMCITMCIHAFRCHATSPRLCVVIKWSISTCHPYQTSGGDCETFTMKTSTGTWARTSGCHLRPRVPVQALHGLTWRHSDLLHVCGCS